MTARGLARTCGEGLFKRSVAPLAAVFAVVLFLSAASVASASSYGPIDLGTLPGYDGSEATAISTNGQVVGYAFNTNGGDRAFSWTQAGGMVDLGTLPGDSSSTASAVSANGQVVGNSDGDAFSWTQAGGMVALGSLKGGAGETFPKAVNDKGQVVGVSGNVAFSWTQAGGMVDLGTLPGGDQSEAYAVNESGQVVGYSSSTQGTHAFLWTQSGGMVDLGTLPGYSSSYGKAVNASGQVVGLGVGNSTAPTASHAFSWTQSGGMVDLGTLPGDSDSDADAVNDSGQVVGYSSGNQGQHAFSWTQSGGMVDLGTLPGDSNSQALAVNDSGQVVGDSDGVSGGSTTHHAFSWTQSGGMIELPSLPGAGAPNVFAVGIDASGQIAGDSGTHSGNSHAVLWVIDTTPPAPFDLVGPPNGIQTSHARPMFSWDQTTDDTQVDHYELWIDGAKNEDVADSACSGGVCSTRPAGTLSDGPHSWMVKAVDSAGNVRASNQTWSLLVDTTPPMAFSNLAPANGSRFDNATPTLQWTASSDSGSGLGGYRVMIDGVQSGPDLPPTATSYTPSTPLADGTYSWQVIAFDNVGNIERGPMWTFVVDTQPPLAALTASTARTVTGAAVSFDASGSTDPEGAGITDYSWDPTGSGDFTSTGSNPDFAYAYTIPGTYTSTVKVTNSVGLTATASTTVTVEPAPPPGNVGVLINGGDYATNNRHVKIDLIWPALTGQVVISNDGGFGPTGNAQTFPIAAEIPWTLGQTGSNSVPSTVYVRFLGAGVDLLTFTDGIVLDKRAPTVKSAALVQGNAAHHRAATSPRHKPRRYTIKIVAKGPIVGICALEASSRRGPGALVQLANCSERGILHLRRDVQVTSRSVPRYVRVKNSAGTWSRWKKLCY